MKAAFSNSKFVALALLTILSIHTNFAKSAEPFNVCKPGAHGSVEISEPEDIKKERFNGCHWVKDYRFKSNACFPEAKTSEEKCAALAASGFHNNTPAQPWNLTTARCEDIGADFGKDATRSEMHLCVQKPCVVEQGTGSSPKTVAAWNSTGSVYLVRRCGYPLESLPGTLILEPVKLADNSVLNGVSRQNTPPKPEPRDFAMEQRCLSINGGQGDFPEEVLKPNVDPEKCRWIRRFKILGPASGNSDLCDLQKACLEYFKKIRHDIDVHTCDQIHAKLGENAENPQKREDNFCSEMICATVVDASRNFSEFQSEAKLVTTHLILQCDPLIKPPLRSPLITVVPGSISMKQISELTSDLQKRWEALNSPKPKLEIKPKEDFKNLSQKSSNILEMPARVPSKFASDSTAKRHRRNKATITMPSCLRLLTGIGLWPYLSGNRRWQ